MTDTPTTALLSSREAIEAFIAKVYEVLCRRFPRCRECADEAGTCPDSGLPCDLTAAFSEVLAAIRDPSGKLWSERAREAADGWTEAFELATGWQDRAQKAEAQIAALTRALAEATQEETSMAWRMRAAVVEARRRLAKGRALWNGPCHECDAVLAEALSVNCPTSAERAALQEQQ
jgi:hypothetical protein